jgi:hypothetical protein
MRKRPLWLILVATALIPVTGWSCEPILPLFQLLNGPSLTGLAVLTDSLFWLLLAVALKSATFICFEKRLPWRQAAWAMFLANVVSTIPGAVLAALTASSTVFGVVVALPLVLFLGWMVQRRVAHLPEANRWRHISGGAAMLAFVAFYIGSMVLYITAEGALHGHDYARYWLVKFLYVTAVACTGIVISAVLEECVIATLFRNSAGNLSFYTAVFRANYITLAFVLLVAAIKMLPRRLHSPHFIAGWFDALRTTLGLS